MEIFSWVVNDASTMRRLISYRLDGIITNKPDVMGKLVRS
jgi:glycerophosphoryl diester phosphodiesterase